MTALVVLVPSRGRPANAARLVEAFAETCTADTLLVLGVDSDDPAGGEYLPLRSATVRVDVLPATGRPGMTPALNTLARAYVDGPRVLGFMGDDHCPRTHGWDTRVLEVLADQPGVAYADDLFQGEALATQVFIDARIVQALGWMAPPEQDHLYLDNFWMMLGQYTRLTFMPDVVIEHMHYLIGKSTEDAVYRAVNDPGMYSHDQDAYSRYMNDGRFLADLERVEEALS